MSNLNTISPITANADFKVNTVTGEAFISQRKAAELTGIPRQTLQDWLKADREKALNENIQPLYKVNENNQLDAKSLQKLVLSGIGKGYEKCTELLEKLMEAGAKAFIYHQAGYSINAVTQQPRPLTFIESLELLLESEKEKERLRIENLNQSVVIEHKNIKTDSSNTHFTIKRIRALNQRMKIDPKILLKVSKDLDSEVETVYDHYDQPINQYSRGVWEEAYPDAILPN